MPCPDAGRDLQRRPAGVPQPREPASTPPGNSSPCGTRSRGAGADAAVSRGRGHDGQGRAGRVRACDAAGSVRTADRPSDLDLDAVPRGRVTDRERRPLDLDVMLLDVRADLAQGVPDEGRHIGGFDASPDAEDRLEPADRRGRFLVGLVRERCPFVLREEASRVSIGPDPCVLHDRCHVSCLPSWPTRASSRQAHRSTRSSGRPRPGRSAC